ncbi:MAG TPA: M14 family zinc carboxypeptidase, partial [Egibacteraceae bacterium]|nr:M14 family zinc carboxypeptidase [Egibacteraceae bacterium]
SYRHLADYERELRDLAEDNPGLVRLVTLPHTSLEGREVLGVEISRDVDATGDGKPTFLMMGLHHAREWPSGEHSMEFALDLVQHAGDERIGSLLERTRVVVVPVVNPDGFDQSRKWGDIADLRQVDDELAAHGEDTGGLVGVLGTPGNAYKRKNCRLWDDQPTPPLSCEAPSPGGFGTGIDLNRNYGGLWGGGGSSDLFADPDYRGPAPFSEPETQNVRDFVSSRHVTTLITNHTYSNLILRPPGTRAAGETVDEAAMKDLGARMAAQNGYRNIHGWQLYDTDGTTEDWSYNATGGYGYTFEIGPDEFHPPFSETVDQYVGHGFYAGKGNREAFLLALENAADPAHHAVLSGKAPDGAVLRLVKEFDTKTSDPALTVDDRLESVLHVTGNRPFEWHVNPSTRPEVMEHRVRVLAETPTREEVVEHTEAGWRPGDHVDFDFPMPEEGVGALKVNLDWPTPDDLDLYVYQKGPGGELIEVGSSGNFIGDKEEAIVDLPDAGDYVIRVVNYASVSPTFTLTAGLYPVDREEVFGGGVVESYTLTCETPDGDVLQTAQVTVDRGQAQKLDLKECARAFRSPPAGAGRT